jgi:cytoskeletal protein CcmA (bactofilin family)
VAVSGSVTGDIIAATKVVLHKTARVCGNIQTGSLVVEDGAEIDGSIKMGKSAAGLKAVDGGAAKALAPEKN